MTFPLELAVSFLLLVGAGFVLIGSIGLARLPDYFSRLHAPTKASTLGIGAILTASMLIPVVNGLMPGFAEMLLTLFVFITSPVSANMLSLAAIRQSKGA